MESKEIIDAFVKHYLEEGKAPNSIYSFSKSLGIEESEFYNHFNDFDQISSHVWTGLFEQVKDQLMSDSEYDKFSSRDKVLSFYFAYFELMKSYRSYFLVSVPHHGVEAIKGSAFAGLGEHYKKWIKEVLDQGVADAEISSRSKLNNTYDELFLYQFIFLLEFWRKDKSVAFEKTDAAIEKSVNLSFDLIEKNALDSALDFGKFMFQNS